MATLADLGLSDADLLIVEELLRRQQGGVAAPSAPRAPGAPSAPGAPAIGGDIGRLRSTLGAAGVDTDDAGMRAIVEAMLERETGAPAAPAAPSLGRGARATDEFSPAAAARRMAEDNRERLAGRRGGGGGQTLGDRLDESIGEREYEARKRMAETITGFGGGTLADVLDRDVVGANRLARTLGTSDEVGRPRGGRASDGRGPGGPQREDGGVLAGAEDVDGSVNVDPQTGLVKPPPPPVPGSERERRQYGEAGAEAGAPVLPAISPSAEAEMIAGGAGPGDPGEVIARMRAGESFEDIAGLQPDVLGMPGGTETLGRAAQRVAGDGARRGGGDDLTGAEANAPLPATDVGTSVEGDVAAGQPEATGAPARGAEPVSPFTPQEILQRAIELYMQEPEDVPFLPESQAGQLAGLAGLGAAVGSAIRGKSIRPLAEGFAGFAEGREARGERAEERRRQQIKDLVDLATLQEKLSRSGLEVSVGADGRLTFSGRVEDLTPEQLTRLREIQAQFPAQPKWRYIQDARGGYWRINEATGERERIEGLPEEVPKPPPTEKFGDVPHQWNAETRTWEPIPDVPQETPKQPRPTEIQSRAQVVLPRAQLALQGLEGLLFDPETEQYAGVPTESLLGRALPGRWLMPAKVQQFNTYVEQLASAIQRMESGAGTPEEETKRYLRQLMPAVGDKPETIATKMETLRRTVAELENVARGIGIEDSRWSPGEIDAGGGGGGDFEDLSDEELQAEIDRLEGGGSPR